MATLAKINEPLSKFDGHIIQRAAIFGLMSQNKDVLVDVFNGLAGSYQSLVSQRYLRNPALMKGG
ncbi:hypothetical protein K734_08320 [Idiomarina loihiensis GSL 199]|nr:hypothetical protein K734_08320 [Idiomarina loihiensis GSL 199]